MSSTQNMPVGFIVGGWRISEANTCLFTTNIRVYTRAYIISNVENMY